MYETTTTATGAWGPVRTRADREYSFDLESGGRHVVYFLPRLTRSTTLLNMRFMLVPADAAAKGGVLVMRPDGYFSRDRDPVHIAGEVSQDEPAGLPIRDSFLAVTPAQSGVLEIKLRDEMIYAQPSADLAKVLAVAEFLR